MKNWKKRFLISINRFFWTLQAIWAQVFCLIGKIFSEGFSQLCLSCREEQFENMNFFIGSIKVVAILLDIELEFFWTWGNSCQQVFQECMHRVQKNPSMEKISHWKKNRMFHHLQKLIGGSFRNLAEVFHDCCLWLVLRAQAQLLRTFIEKTTLILFDSDQSFSEFQHKFFATFSEQNSTLRGEELEGNFSCTSKSF